MKVGSGFPDVAVVGAGIFGVCAAEAFARRGATVTLLDPGPIPHPYASSTDISKAVRSDYGDDLFFTRWAREAIRGWRAWNEEAERALFHEVGFVACTHGRLEESSFEAGCRRLHEVLGAPVERWSAERLRERYPALRLEGLGESHFNPEAGWASSARTVEWRLQVAQRAGVSFQPGFCAEGWIGDSTKVTGVRSVQGEQVSAGLTVIAAGAWTPSLVPELSDRLRPSGQTVMHFDASADPRLGGLPVWCADISKTGWYGFPADAEGRFKVGHHGIGRAIRPPDVAKLDDAPPPGAGDEARFREFLARSFPQLSRAPLLGSRVCFYCDSFDGDFWIDRHPERSGAMVAAGGSGHGFKFAPSIGDLIVDIAEGRRSEAAERFRWREKGQESRERARSQA